MTTHLVDVVYGASEGYSAQQTKFMGKPEHITGESVMVDVATPDFSAIRSFGPYTWTDATLYAQHAQGLDTFEQAVAFMLDIDRRHAAAHYPGNDWTGLLAPLALV